MKEVLWRAFAELSARVLVRARERAVRREAPAAPAAPPAAHRVVHAAAGTTFSLLMLSRRFERALVVDTVRSLANQTDAGWELLVIEDLASPPAPEPYRRALAELCSGDARVRWFAASFGLAYRSCFELARGAWIATIGEGDVLEPNALAQVAGVIATRPDIAWIYTGEDLVDAKGRLRATFGKPTSNPDLLYAVDYSGALSVARRSLFADAPLPATSRDERGWWHRELLRCVHERPADDALRGRLQSRR
jgi:O-antigen biosynthesis protein